MSRYLLLIALAGFSLANAQLTDSRLPISLDADFLDSDIDSDMYTFRGLRLNQGLMSIEADTGRASRLDFNDAEWQLSGNVSIVVEDGRIDCDAANLKFGNNQLRIASISGRPARFELTREDGGVTTYAEADVLRYDLEAGAIEFSGNAKITEGGNQIASGFLVYNIGERRIQAQGSDEEDGKVKITFTPGDESTEASVNDSTETQPDEESTDASVNDSTESQLDDESPEFSDRNSTETQPDDVSTEASVNDSAESRLDEESDQSTDGDATGAESDEDTNGDEDPPSAPDDTTIEEAATDNADDTPGDSPP